MFDFYGLSSIFFSRDFRSVFKHQGRLRHRKKQQRYHHRVREQKKIESDPGG
jgi:hypothetical protein